MPTVQEQTVTESKTPLSPVQTQMSVQIHAHQGSELWDRVWLFWRLFSLKPYLFDIATFAGILRGEVRSCYNHICVLSANRIHWGRGCSAGLDLGPVFDLGPDGTLEPCKATHARNSCIQYMLAKYPWISYGDAFLILQGWELGREYALGNAHTPQKNTE
jgi:hypothetical protein